MTYFERKRLSADSYLAKYTYTVSADSYIKEMHKMQVNNDGLGLISLFDKGTSIEVSCLNMYILQRLWIYEMFMKKVR
jgi:hypothetical protein